MGKTPLQCSWASPARGCAPAPLGVPGRRWAGARCSLPALFCGTSWKAAHAHRHRLTVHNSQWPEATEATAGGPDRTGPAGHPPQAPHRLGRTLDNATPALAASPPCLSHAKLPELAEPVGPLPRGGGLPRQRDGPALDAGRTCAAVWDLAVSQPPCFRLPGWWLASRPLNLKCPRSRGLTSPSYTPSRHLPRAEDP